MNEGQKQDRAEEFLAKFLLRLQESDRTNAQLVQTNRELVQALRHLVQQNSQLIQQNATMSAQADGIAQRCDFLYEQMGRLGSLISGDSGEIEHHLPAEPGNPLPLLGDVVQGAVDHFVFNQNGGRRRRR